MQKETLILSYERMVENEKESSKIDGSGCGIDNRSGHRCSECIRLHQKVRNIYKLYNAEKNLGLHITEGPHKDTQELRIHAFV